MARTPPRASDVVARQMHQALVLHFLEGRTQAEIAQMLGLSHATVNRLIKRGRQLGLVEIKVLSPVEGLVDVEESLVALGGLDGAIVVPSLEESPQTTLARVGEAAGRVLLDTLKDGDTICVSGGKGVSALVAGLKPTRRYDVEIVPATGLVQGKHYTDVNHVASLMADKLGGRAYQIHAPLFAETPQQRDLLMGVRAVADVFKRAREADVAVVGIGSILTAESSYYDLHPSSTTDRAAIEASGAVGELLAHLIDERGRVCDYSPNRSLVSLTLEEFAAIPRSIGIASGPAKAAPILSVICGDHIDVLVTDEATGRQIVQLSERKAA